MEDKHEAHSVTEQSKFLRWLDNFWFHYKWQTIAALAVVILLAVTIPQCVAKNDEDGITVNFAGGYVTTASERDSVKRVLLSATDGNIVFGQYSIFTQEEIEKNNTYIDEATGEEKIDRTGVSNDTYYNQDRLKSLQSYIMTGDCGVWIVSPYVYETCFAGRIQIVEDRRLGDLALWETNPEIRFFGEDCRVLLTRSVFGETSKDAAFEVVRAYYETLVSSAD